MRRRRLGRVLTVVVSVLLVVSILLAVFAVYTVRRSFPQTEGEVQIAGLDGPVDIYRDTMGVPHIYAGSEHDLFFAQGFVHAQDRFWQMDFWRHIGSARLSEMFGESQLETDQFLRTMGWARIAQQELEVLPAEHVAILEAYAEGVNAYLTEHSAADLSLEYSILGLLTPDYQVEPWEPLHTLTWAKAMAWDLGGNMDEEIKRAILLKTLTPEQLAEIDPQYPSDHPVILPDFKIGVQAAQAESRAGLYASPQVTAALQTAAEQAQKLDRLIGPRGNDIGSNNWVIAGERTGTGMPLLANDPHLGIQMPSIWYEVGLHCREKSDQCRLNVAGFSFAGTPGVVIGHNDRIAWGFTNVGPDVQDLYIEKINPDNPNQYEVNGEWVDMDMREETIRVAGGDPVTLTVRSTRHGPLITETYGGLDTLAADSGLDLPENYAIALRWTALEEGSIFSAVWKLDLAQNWDEFRQAAALFDAPAQNLVYADVDGNIGYQMPGRIPRRANGDGRLPVPGWTDEYEWEDYIPFEELPYSFNPERGYIATANNAVVGPDYPYIITSSFDMGYRATRIVEMIENAPGPIDAAYIQTMQGDNRDLSADFTLPVLEGIAADGEWFQQARDSLLGWDRQAHRDSAPAALYAAFWRQLLALTFQDQLPEDYWPGGGDGWFEVMRTLVDQPDSQWWDDLETPEVERRDQIFALALERAVQELETLRGSNPQRWNWGDLHGAEFRNRTLGESGVGPIEALFNRGPFRTSGGPSIVNATGWDAAMGYVLRSVPSMRMIVDLGQLENSATIHTTGQSGHAYHPHYIDMAEMWASIEYHQMLWSLSQVQANSTKHLRLTP